MLHLYFMFTNHVDGLVQDYGNSSAKAMELLQPYTKPSVCSWFNLTVQFSCNIAVRKEIDSKHTTSIGSDNALALNRRQAFTWSNAIKFLF